MSAIHDKPPTPQDDNIPLQLKKTSLKDGGVMDKRYVDLAIYHMLLDAKELGEDAGSAEPIRMVNKRLFRRNEDVPVVDELAADPTTVIGLLHGKP